MKSKLILIGSTVLLFISCKKDYTCECTSLYGVTISTIHNTNKKAQKECNETVIYNNSQETSCKIK